MVLAVRSAGGSATFLTEDRGPMKQKRELRLPSVVHLSIRIGPRLIHTFSSTRLGNLREYHDGIEGLN